MRGHIVGPFGVVTIRPILRREAIEIGLDIAAYCGICVFLDQKRGRGMPAEDGQQTGLHSLPTDPFANGRADLVAPLAAGRDFEGVC